MSALIDFPVPTPTSSTPQPEPEQAARPTPRHGGGYPSPRAVAAPRSAAALLREARAGIVEAQHETDAAQRYATAYLAALRAAAAMLALRGRPHRGRARPASAWVLLATLAPELREWADFFAAGSGRRAAILAGITRGVTQRCADDLVRSAAIFADLVDDEVAERGGANPPDPARTRAVT
ncbi:MAG TPA: SAV_6107 family HEPN domain-containing protein [Pseudonocardiaceae bacterium]|jgi:hypothetical protein|nr:SAV_6107 family HEPN domain-containing protein [Pseudonocardiaceae bacterium]